MSLGPFSKQDHLEITTLGLEFAMSEILGVFIGYKMDIFFKTSPWFIVLGALAGFCLGFYIILRSAKNMEKQAANLIKKEKENERR